jgi:hypothetical protein
MNRPLALSALAGAAALGILAGVAISAHMPSADTARPAVPATSIHMFPGGAIPQVAQPAATPHPPK